MSEVSVCGEERKRWQRFKTSSWLMFVLQLPYEIQRRGSFWSPLMLTHILPLPAKRLITSDFAMNYNSTSALWPDIKLEGVYHQLRNCRIHQYALGHKRFLWISKRLILFHQWEPESLSVEETIWTHEGGVRFSAHSLFKMPTRLFFHSYELVGFNYVCMKYGIKTSV